MRRFTFLSTLLALAVVAVLATACDRPANPTGPVATPTEVGFPPNYTPGAPTAPPVATKPPERPTAAGTAVAPTVPAPAPTAAPTAAPTVPPATVPPPTAAPTAGPTTAPGVTTYTVKAGDNLFRIALSYGLSWETLAAYNGITNPNAIYVGQVIKIPVAGAPGPTPVPTGKTHVVQAGENLFRISLAYGLPYTTVAAYNNIPYPYIIYVGQVIRIP